MSDRSDPPVTTRLCLAMTAISDLSAAAALLEAALSGSDVACLFLPDEAGAETLIAIAQQHGVAAMLSGEPARAEHLGADGVHIEAGRVALKAAITAARPRLMVGAGRLTGRDAAMRAGELQPDYVFFGRLDGDTGPEIFPKAYALAAWWSPLFEIPAVVMGGSQIDSVNDAVAAGVEFVCLRTAIWDDPHSPSAAVEQANRLLAASPAETVS